MALKIKTGETLKISIETSDETHAAELVSQVQDFLKG